MASFQSIIRRYRRTMRAPQPARPAPDYEALERPGGFTDVEWETAKAIARQRGATGRDLFRQAGDVCLYEPELVYGK